MFLVIKAYNHFEDIVSDEETEEAAAESKRGIIAKRN